MAGQIYDQQTLLLATDTPMTADFDTTWHEIWGFDCGSFTITWTGANRSTGVLIPQFSNDLTHWCGYVTEAQAKRVTSGAGDALYEFPIFAFKYVRLRFLAKTNTTGTLSVLSFAKRAVVQR